MSTEDRELLELAAKAEGVDMSSPVYFDEDKDSLSGYCVSTGATSSRIWNPLRDDGDAMRLAVRLNISIHPETDSPCGYRTYTCMGSEFQQCEMHGTDPYAATRRAIVRAAAEIGKDIG